MSEDKEQGPERIWTVGGRNGHFFDRKGNFSTVEYIRADLAQRPVIDQKRIAEIRERQSARKQWGNPPDAEKWATADIDYLLSCIQPAGELTDDPLTGNERGVLNVLAGTWHRERHEGSDVFNCPRWPCHIMTAAIRERCNSVEQKDQVKQ